MCSTGSRLSPTSLMTLSIPLSALRRFQSGRRRGSTGKPWTMDHRTHFLAFRIRASVLSRENNLVLPRSQPELKVVNDQIGSPTYTKDLAGAIRRIDPTWMHAGILNITNSGSCTWFEYAKEILREGRSIRTSISPITSAESHRPARRPAYSVLSPIALNKRGISLRNWQDALDDYLERTAPDRQTSLGILQLLSG